MPVFIIEPVRQRIALSVSNKVACVSTRLWLWEMAYGPDSWDHADCIFKAFEQWTIPYGGVLPDSVSLAVAVHRDGISRLRAVYDHRIRREGNAPDKGLDYFARHLPEYVALHPDIAHHTRPQSEALGSDHQCFTDILPLSKLDLLPRLAEQITGCPAPPLPRTHETIEKSPVSEEAAWWFSQWTAHDTALGWDGKTLKIYGESKMELEARDEGMP